VIKVIQKDNRLEFLGDFDSYFKKKNIKHVFIYPRYPTPILKDKTGP
jgi:hypothetical protein